jgi:hypothetical protein
MNAKEPTFKWDAFGLSAYDIDWANGEISGTVNKNKFVRFDKYGIYGIDAEPKYDSDGNLIKEVVDGFSWKPSSNDDIDRLATFSLTWSGLKVTGNNKTVARIGAYDG